MFLFYKNTLSYQKVRLKIEQKVELFRRKIVVARACLFLSTAAPGKVHFSEEFFSRPTLSDAEGIFFVNFTSKGAIL